MSVHEHPFPGNILQTVGTFHNDYDGIGTMEPRYFTDDLDEAEKKAEAIIYF